MVRGLKNIQEQNAPVSYKEGYELKTSTAIRKVSENILIQADIVFAHHTIACAKLV